MSDISFIIHLYICNNIDKHFLSRALSLSLSRTKELTKKKIIYKTKGRAEEEERRNQEFEGVNYGEDDDGDEEFEYDNTGENRICPDHEFECASDQKCIPLDAVCNSIVDCLDGSDEEICGFTPGPIITLPTETETFDDLSSSTTSMPATIDVRSTEPSTALTTTAANDDENTIDDKGDLSNTLCRI